MSETCTWLAWVNPKKEGGEGAVLHLVWSLLKSWSEWRISASELETYAGTDSDGSLCGALSSMDARPIVRHGSTISGSVRLKEGKRRSTAGFLHSPFVNRTLDGAIFHPPYLFTFPTAGEPGRPLGKVALQPAWKKSRERKDVSIERGLDGSPR